MRCIEIIECTVADGGMPDFINAVQQWERAAMAHPDAPMHHSVLLDDINPARVTIITQFEDQETADRFSDSHLIDQFMAGVLKCIEPSASGRRFSLFYAAGTGGPHAIFGEQPKEG
ncbi:MAG: hypothetical protein OES13_11535 [Acidimicrobiia bacterium]|nr:hypothetical protein [Acidimicrobiia bacterium]